MSFGGIAGHETAKQVLTRAILTDRVSHAYLFEGPAHVGKTLTAVAFAKALMCAEPPEPAESCNACAICRAVGRGNHPDFLLLFPTSRLETTDEEGQKAVAEIEGSLIRREAIGQLIDRAYGRAVSARRKVLIVSDAQAMNEEAANHLLKTLEEPPGRTTIILTATSADSLLPTIVSRSQLVRFGPVPLAETQAAMTRAFPGLDSALVRSVAALSGGRPGWARRLLEHPDTLAIRRRLLDRVARLPDQPPLVCMRAAEILIDDAEAWWLATSEGHTARELLKRNRDRVLRTQVGELLDLLVTWFRDLSIAGEEGAEGLLINADRIAELKRAAGRAPNCAAAGAAVSQAKEALRGNANLRLTVEVMLIRVRRALTAAVPGPAFP
ncbi:MAG: AAA family ATPase [Armatimonadetes bacterium]|nr:AAA family ATPase [Armatimonadota bacterium]